MKKASVRLALACFECLTSSIFFSFFLRKLKVVKKNIEICIIGVNFFGNGILIRLKCQLNPLKDLNMMKMYEHVNEM